MPRTLPLRAAPMAGESIDSWLEVLCYRMHSQWSDVLRHVGLPVEPHRRYAASWMIRLTPEQAGSLSVATGVDEARLQAMTLDHLGDVFSRNSPLSGASMSAMSWLRARRSRFCPQCLAESGGRWQSWWRFRWAFACVDHRCLLVDVCPACRQTQRNKPAPAGLIPTPGLCTVKRAEGLSGDVYPCGHPFAEAATPPLDPDGPAVQSQKVIVRAANAELIADGIYRSQPASAGQLIADLAALGGRILTYATPAELVQRLPEELIDPYRTSQEGGHAGQRAVTADASALATAVAVTSAWSILQAQNATEAGARLRWLVESGRRTGAVRATNLGWGRGVSCSLLATQLSALAPFLSPSDQLRYRTHSPSPRLAGRSAAQERSRHLPSLLWRAISLPMQTEGVGFPQLQSALSVGVAIVGAAVSISEAAALLGSVVKAQGVSRVLQRIMRGDLGEQSLRCLTELANYLDAVAPPIDYTRRRALPCDNLLPERRWNELCVTTGVGPGRGLRLRLTRCWLHEQLTGLPGERCSSAVDSPEFRTKLANLPALLTAEFHLAMNAYASEYLSDHGIVDEPPTWSPDHFLPTDVFLQQRSSPAIPSAAIPCRFNSRILATAQLLPKLRLAELYLTERRSLADIAKETGVSRQMVTRLARCYGLELRQPGRPRTP